MFSSQMWIDPKFKSIYISLPFCMCSSQMWIDPKFKSLNHTGAAKCTAEFCVGSYHPRKCIRNKWVRSNAWAGFWPTTTSRHATKERDSDST